MHFFGSLYSLFSSASEQSHHWQTDNNAGSLLISAFIKRKANSADDMIPIR